MATLCHLHHGSHHVLICICPIEPRVAMECSLVQAEVLIQIEFRHQFLGLRATMEGLSSQVCVKDRHTIPKSLH